MNKQIGIIGLGKMGGNLALNMIDHGWKVVGYNRTKSVTQEYEEKGVIGAYTYGELLEKLEGPHLVWIMTSHKAVDSVLGDLVPLLSKGDTIIEGGNSPFKETIRRAQEIEAKGINFLDVGVSGGPGGARDGACCMIGGRKELFEELEELFKDISVENGYGHFGKSGAGHFVKMVHNGIEYGMMQAIGEGFEVMKQSDFDLDLTDITRVYNHGSVITSRLVGWLESGYQKYGEELDSISSSVSHSGEGEWTVQTAQELDVPVKIIQESLRFREQSKNKPSYTGKVVSVLRNQFGHHDVAE